MEYTILEIKKMVSFINENYGHGWKSQIARNLNIKPSHVTYFLKSKSMKNKGIKNEIVNLYNQLNTPKND